MTTRGTAEIRQYSARIARFVSVLWTALAALVVLEHFSALTIGLFSSDFAESAVRALACEAVTSIPDVLFLVGLWWVRQALIAFSRGEWFARPLTTMLERLGVVLACAAAVRVFVVPGACRLLGNDPGYWIAFDAAGLLLIAIGLSIRAIAGVLRHASVIQSELDEIF